MIIRQSHKKKDSYRYRVIFMSLLYSLHTHMHTPLLLRGVINSYWIAPLFNLRLAFKVWLLVDLLSFQYRIRWHIKKMFNWNQFKERIIYSGIVKIKETNKEWWNTKKLVTPGSWSHHWAWINKEDKQSKCGALETWEKASRRGHGSRESWRGREGAGWEQEGHPSLFSQPTDLQLTPSTGPTHWGAKEQRIWWHSPNI